MLLPPVAMILARVYPHARVHVDMTAFRRTCCVSCRASMRVHGSHVVLYPLPHKGRRGNSSDVLAFPCLPRVPCTLVAFIGSFFEPISDRQTVTCVASFSKQFFLRTGFWSGVTARSCGTFRPRFFDKKSFAFGRPVHEISERFQRGAARNVCTKKERFLFWRFVKEQMRSRLLRPVTIKRTKKKGRACVSHSIESNKYAERTGDPALLFLVLIKQSFRRSRATQWIRTNRPRRRVPERLLVCESCSCAYKMIGSGKSVRLCRAT